MHRKYFEGSASYYTVKCRGERGYNLHGTNNPSRKNFDGSGWVPNIDGGYTNTTYYHKRDDYAFKIVAAVTLVCLAVLFFNNQSSIGSNSGAKTIMQNFTPNFLSNSKPVLTGQDYATPTITLPIDNFFEEPSIDEIEQLTYQKINALRSKSLKWNPKMGALARNHSEDMVARNFFDHVNPSGQDVADRASKAGISYAIIGENISQIPTGNVVGCGGVYTVEEIAQCAVDGWGDSPGHYANIMEKQFSETGVGVAQKDSAYYFTQVFR